MSSWPSATRSTSTRHSIIGKGCSTAARWSTSTFRSAKSTRSIRPTTRWSDARLAVCAMTEALDAKTGARAPAVVDGRDYESRIITPLPGAIHPARLAQIVGRLLPERGIVLADAGAHLTWLGYYLELESDQHFRKAG